jgi:hypothetical protein
MDVTTPKGSRWYLGAALGVLAMAVAGCGARGGSSSGPSSSTQTLKRLDVQIVRRTAQSAGAVDARASGRSPRLAAGGRGVHCQVTAGGVSATTGPDEGQSARGGGQPRRDGPGLDQCSDGTNGTFTLAGAVPGAVVTVSVEVEPGGVEVRLRDQRVSPPSKPSLPSRASKPSSKSGSGRS